MRGKGSLVLPTAAFSGITPAYAGKRVPEELGRAAHQDHPRVCGEKCRWQGQDKRQAGSPPRMRGKGHIGHSRTRQKRITPAYAGKRPATSPRSARQTDHPRVCGEKWTPCKQCMTLLGSPPRMRGKVSQCPASRAGPGITPAYAGKRAGLAGLALSHRDHPRVCGEKVCKEIAPLSGWGSPPRMRGKD